MVLFEWLMLGVRQVICARKKNLMTNFKVIVIAVIFIHRALQSAKDMTYSYHSLFLKYEMEEESGMRGEKK